MSNKGQPSGIKWKKSFIKLKLKFEIKYINQNINLAPIHQEIWEDTENENPKTEEKLIKNINKKRLNNNWSLILILELSREEKKFIKKVFNNLNKITVELKKNKNKKIFLKNFRKFKIWKEKIISNGSKMEKSILIMDLWKKKKIKKF